MINHLIIKIIVFLSAFLLFQIELITAKLLLPHYGGSYLVWGACVVFFQVILFLGYLFVQLGTNILTLKRYLGAHIFLILLPFIFFPGKNLVIHYSYNQFPLVVGVFLNLLFTIGPVFLALATISILMQVWVNQSNLHLKENPYALYAVSNLGSFAALLIYPIIVEYYFSLSQQIIMWRVLYVLFVLLNFLAIALIKVHPFKKEEIVIEKVGLLKKTSWFLLGASGVILFLAVTNIMTYEVSPVPLFWVIPLSIYLLTFVLNFKKKIWCPLWIPDKVPSILSLSFFIVFIIQKNILPATIEAFFLSGALFLLCMYCQNRLIVHKPAFNESLPIFYTTISLGSCVGGILTTWFFPLISRSIIEFSFALSLIVISDILLMRKEDIHFKSLIERYWILAASVVVIVVINNFSRVYSGYQTIYKDRNYYGIYEVYDKEDIRYFLHGTTIHGAQYLKENKNTPLAYYSPTSPIGEIMADTSKNFQQIGFIGLGVGTLAVYGNPQQTFDFYELDPDVYAIARKYFTYLDISKAQNNFIFGDARISLEKNKNSLYDVIVVDAFGGDSIPVHLINQDMIKKYHQHLRENGFIFFHITNRYLNLNPVLAQIADSLNAHVCFRKTEALGFNSTWLAITWNKNNLLYLKEKGWLELSSDKHMRVWTDQYSSILPILKFDLLKDILKMLNNLNKEIRMLY